MQIRATTTDDDDLADVVRMRLDFIADLRGIAPETLDPAFVTATDRFVRDRAAADRLHSWIAEDAGERVGLVSVLVADAPPLPEELRAREGYVVNMFVVPSARRRGIARAMLDAVIEAAPVLGLRRLYLHSTDAGRPLYGEAGFTTDTRWMARRLPLELAKDASGSGRADAGPLGPASDTSHRFARANPTEPVQPAAAEQMVSAIIPQTT